MQNDLLTTPEVAQRLGVGIRRVQQFIHEGRLPSQQFGRDHLIKASDLALVLERKAGRPKKESAASSAAANGSTGAKPAVSSKPTKKGTTN